jgi:hypothetical protein
MFLGRTLREQAQVYTRMAQECDDKHLAERLYAMARNLRTMADDTEAITDHTDQLRATSL